MASDSPDSRSKHRRSPSDGDLHEHSKRHKHRHHHRSHRHHGHHKSRSTSYRKHVEDTKGDIDKMNEERIDDLVEESEEIAPPPPPVLDKIRVEYDMEEGEIVEDDPVLDGNGRLEDETVGSLVESSEIRSGIEKLDMDAVDRISKPMRDDDLMFDVVSGLALDKSVSKNTWSSMDGDIILPMENKVSKDIILPRRSFSPVSGGDKQKRHLDIDDEEGSLKNMEVEEIVSGQHTISYDVRSLMNRRHSQSPSAIRYDTVCLSESVEGASERTHATRPRGGHRKGGDVFCKNGKIDCKSDDERASPENKKYRHGSRDLLKDKERPNSSYSCYAVHEDRHSGHWSRERDREEKLGWYERSDKEEEVIRASKEHGKGKERERDRHKNRERSRGKDREHEGDGEKAGERIRDMGQLMEPDRNRKREKNCGRSKERVEDRDLSRDISRTVIRDRYAETEWEGNRYRDGDRAKDRVDDGRRDRREYRSRDIETGRSSNYQSYNDYEGGFDEWEKSHDFKHPVHDANKDHISRSRNHDSLKDHVSKYGSALGSEDKKKRDEEDQDDYQETLDLKLAEEEEEDLNRIKEESRRRREAILKKYKIQQLKQESTDDVDDTEKAAEKEQDDQTFHSFDMKDAHLRTVDTNSDNQDEDFADTSFSVGKSPHANDGLEKDSGVGGLGEGTPKIERSGDIFCDDIFGDSPAGIHRSGKPGGLLIERSGLHDNWDDPEGYYSYRIGEVLDGRYEITAAHGKGVFSTVVRAKDLRAGNGNPEEVAVKIIRNNETMLKAGMEELVILKKLVGADPEDRRRCVRFLSSFKYRNHLCLVFESLHMNLREVLKKFGRNIGLKLTAVRTYAKQLFIALKHLRNCGVLHCDIKPDNMLVNDSKNVLKLCDFGNAMFAGKNEITPYLVSRFYRSPEIILGLPYDHPMDMWSVGCCLYELYTGKVLFPGPTNNDMLRLHMELKGPFPKKMLRKGAFIEQHFDQDLNFLATEEDPVTKKVIKRLIVNIKPKDITSMIKGSPGEDPKMMANFKDLLDRIFMLDPDKRLTVSQALNHSFITGK